MFVSVSRFGVVTLSKRRGVHILGANKMKKGQQGFDPGKNNLIKTT